MGREYFGLRGQYSQPIDSLQLVLEGRVVTAGPPISSVSTICVYPRRKHSTMSMSKVVRQIEWGRMTVDLISQTLRPIPAGSILCFQIMPTLAYKDLFSVVL